MDKYEMAKLEAISAILGADSERTLSALGDQLANDQKHGLTGIDAVRYHLIQKHNWLPRDVRAMSIEDMKLACAAELESMESSEELNDFHSVLTAAASNIRLEAQPPSTKSKA